MKALQNLEVPHKHLFDCDIDHASQKVSECIYEPKEILTDVRNRDVTSMPATDYFHYSPPCKDYSTDGKRLGSKQTRGRLWRYSIAYIRVWKPKLVSYEMVMGILGKKHKCEFLKMVACLKKFGYKCHARVVNTCDHGIPHRRCRVFLVGAQQWRRRFKWPKPVGVKWSVSSIIQQRPTDNALKLPTKRDQTIGGRRRRSLVKKGYKWLLAHNINPQNRYTFIDIGCSLSRAPNPTVDLLPCMTAARAASCDWWLTPRGGKITTRELFQFQGLTASDYEEWREKTKLSDRQLGILMGNAMSLNVTERIVGKALWCAGLVMKRPPDRWA